MIKSISDNQGEILSSILTLIGEEFFQLDPCYGNGLFYKTIPYPEHRIDIADKPDLTMRCDCRELPFESGSIRSIIYDPPFLATSGPSLKLEDDSNAINKRFSVYPNEKELHKFYYYSLVEFNRVLRDNGQLIVKCQDKVSGGKQYFSHVYIHNMAYSLGFYPKDLFILIALNRISADWQRANQLHARKFHSYFWIFNKTKPKVNEDVLWRQYDPTV